MVIEFGSGVLYGKPVLGNLPADPTPFKFGILQEVTVDFKGDLKKLYGQYQFAVATARGKLDVSIKGKLAVFDVSMINQLYFAQTETPGMNMIADSEPQTVTTGAVTINNPPIITDWGVQDANTGYSFINVPSGPAVGQYSGPNLTTGLYTFNTGDNGRAVKVSYTYAVNNGATIVLASQLMGYAPELQMLLYNNFRNKYLSINLNDVTLGSISFPSKLEDFWISDFDGSANASTGTLGSLMMATS
jgi:hypothetical protein